MKVNNQSHLVFDSIISFEESLGYISVFKVQKKLIRQITNQTFGYTIFRFVIFLTYIELCDLHKVFFTQSTLPYLRISSI